MQFLNSDKNNTKVYLFIRKNKDDIGAKEFYFLGQMHATGLCKEITMGNSSIKAVELGSELEDAIEPNLYEYLTQ